MENNLFLFSYEFTCNFLRNFHWRKSRVNSLGSCIHKCFKFPFFLFFWFQTTIATIFFHIYILCVYFFRDLISLKFMISNIRHDHDYHDYHSDHNFYKFKKYFFLLFRISNIRHDHDDHDHHKFSKIPKKLFSFYTILNISTTMTTMTTIVFF